MNKASFAESSANIQIAEADNGMRCRILALVQEIPDKSNQLKVFSLFIYFFRSVLISSSVR